MANLLYLSGTAGSYGQLSPRPTTDLRPGDGWPIFRPERAWAPIVYHAPGTNSFTTTYTAAATASEAYSPGVCCGEVT